MDAAGVHLGRRRIADDRPHRDERRLVGDSACGLDGFFYSGDVLAALDLLHVPPVGAVARRNILGQRDIRVVFDRDLILVVEHDQIAELLGAGKGGGLAGDALLHVAVGGDDVDVVVERALTGRCVGVEETALVARRHRHADRRRQTLPQRPRRDLDTRGVAELRVARGLGLPGAQRLDVSELQPEATEVQLDVQREAGVSTGQNETIAAQPVDVAGVMAHLALEQRVGQRCQAHRRSGVAVADLLDRIRREYPDGVHRDRVHLGPVVGMIGTGKGGNLFERGHRHPLLVEG